MGYRSLLSHHSTDALLISVGDWMGRSHSRLADPEGRIASEGLTSSTINTRKREVAQGTQRFHRGAVEVLQSVHFAMFTSQKLVLRLHHSAFQLQYDAFYASSASYVKISSELFRLE